MSFTDEAAARFESKPFAPKSNKSNAAGRNVQEGERGPRQGRRVEETMESGKQEQGGEGGQIREHLSSSSINTICKALKREEMCKLFIQKCLLCTALHALLCMCVCVWGYACMPAESALSVKQSKRFS